MLYVFKECAPIFIDVASGETQWASVRSIARNARCRNIRADAIVALSE